MSVQGAGVYERLFRGLERGEIRCLFMQYLFSGKGSGKGSSIKAGNVLFLGRLWLPPL